MSLKQLVISGTGPTNPRSGADIIERLRAFRAGAEHQRNEVWRCHLYADLLRELLQKRKGLSEVAAREIAGGVAGELAALKELLEQAYERAGRAMAAVEDTGVAHMPWIPWRPTSDRGPR